MKNKKNNDDTKFKMQSIISSFGEALVAGVVIYFCLTSFNSSIVFILNGVSEGKISALEMTVIMVLVIFCLSIIFKFGYYVANKKNK